MPGPTFQIIKRLTLAISTWAIELKYIWSLTIWADNGAVPRDDESKIIYILRLILAFINYFSFIFDIFKQLVTTELVESIV